jgi:hypothetical protein
LKKSANFAERESSESGRVNGDAIMSVSGVSGSTVGVPQVVQSTFQKVKSDFAQLGKDLKSGNLSQAQADFATLSKDLPNGQANQAPPTGDPLSALGKALQSGNLSQAQQAYATIQQSVPQSGGHHHHHHQAAPSPSGTGGSLSQDFSTLGKDLQSGDTSSAQKDYVSVQKDLQQIAAQNQAQTTQAAPVTGSK